MDVHATRSTRWKNPQVPNGNLLKAFFSQHASVHWNDSVRPQWVPNKTGARLKKFDRVLKDVINKLMVLPGC